MNRNTKFYENIKSRYFAKPSLVNTALIHRRTRANAQCVKQQFTKTQIMLHKHTHKHETLETLLNSNQSLHALSNALWRIHNSNDSRLSKNLTQLVTQITYEQHSQPADIEALIQAVISRFQSEQSEQWRLEKMQRGLF
ncbi:MAG: hypothetical protein FWE74_08600 [Oscillospiraceae bacterium]|nr:hypothetical protein [Oscillospiraceae bacterium]